MLVNHFQPRLKETLARQRRDYGIDESFEAEHPIADLSEKVRENTPVHNLPMESFSGKVGHRAQKNRHLEATSGSIMIDGTKELRKKYGDSFRGFKDSVRRVKDIKYNWRQKQDSIFGEKLLIKQANNFKDEGRILKNLKALKKDGGPFTTTCGIDQFLNDQNITSHEKRKRMKKEVQYAGDTLLSIPHTNPVFGIRTPKQVGKKSRELNAEEFGTNLKTLIEKKTAALVKNVTISQFISTMDSMDSSNT